MISSQGQEATFVSSYRKLSTWPRNLTHNAYRPVLDLAAERLEAASNRLFTAEEEPLICFRDYDDNTGRFQKHKVCRDPARPKDKDPDQKLREYLGDVSTWDATAAQFSGSVITKADPQCRFVFLMGGHSRKELLVTATMFKRLMTYHQVSDAYVDYVTVFGLGDRPRDLRFGGFSDDVSLGPVPRAMALPMARRSGLEYQLCYNLKAPARLHSGLWSIQQAAVHHQFDVKYGRALWVITKGDDELKQSVQDLTGSSGIPDSKNFQTPATCFAATLIVQQMLALWCSERWRGYVEYYENVMEDRTGLALYASRDPGTVRYVYRPRDLQDIQLYQDKVKESIVVMKLNIKVLQDMMQFYTRMTHNTNLPPELNASECIAHAMLFSNKVDKMIQGLNVHIGRAELMSDLMENRKALIIQHLQAQTTETMSRLAFLAGADTVAMRIITIVTLIFLPATFVSTFFSTDVVKYQADGDGSPQTSSREHETHFSSLALERWIEVTIPLTAVTAIAAIYLYRRAIKSRHFDTDLKTLV